MGAVRLIAASARPGEADGRPDGRLGRSLQTTLPGYAVGAGRKADLTSRMHFWSRIRHLDPVFLVSFRASPVASVVRGSFFVKQ